MVKGALLKTERPYQVNINKSGFRLKEIYLYQLCNITWKKRGKERYYMFKLEKHKDQAYGSTNKELICQPFSVMKESNSQFDLLNMKSHTPIIQYHMLSKFADQNTHFLVQQKQLIVYK